MYCMHLPSKNIFNAKITIFCQPQVSVVFSCWRKLFLSINLSVSLLSLSLMREDIKYRPNSRLTLLRSVLPGGGQEAESEWWSSEEFGAKCWVRLVRSVYMEHLMSIPENYHFFEAANICCIDIVHTSFFEGIFEDLTFWPFQDLCLSLGLIFSGAESLDYHLRWWHVEMRHKHRHLDMRHRVTTQTDQSENSIQSCDHWLTN